MKIFFTFIILTIFSNFSCQRSVKPNKKEFEGKITYEISVISKTNEITTEELQKIYGTKMTKYFKGGNFKMEYNGEDIQEIYYLQKENSEFDIRKGIDSLFVTSYETENRKLQKSIFEKSEIIILNKKCNLLIHETENIKNFYWYNHSLFINPENYKESKFGFTNIYYEQTSSAWLKFKFQGENIEINYTAISIEEEKVDNSKFNLPQLPKSYYR